MNIFKALIPLTVAALLAGCNSSSTSTTTSTDDKGAGATAGGEAPKKTLKVGILFDSGGRGDKSFNDSAWEGIERAKAEFKIEEIQLQSKSQADNEVSLTQLASQNPDIVFAVGLTMQDAVNNVSQKFKNVKFAIVDGDAKQDNVRMLKFREEQGSFLAGYLAGLMTTTNKIGFVGGMEIPLIKKFEYGYYAGAKMANPKIELLPSKYTGDWNNSDKGKAAAATLFSAGADIVYHAAGRAGLGVFAAAKDAKRFAIGVDSQQDDLEPKTILTSMIKRVDMAVYSTIKDVLDDKFTSGEKLYDVASSGVALSEFPHTKDIIGSERIDKVEAIKAKLASGEIVAPADKDAFDKFIANLPK